MDSNVFIYKIEQHDIKKSVNTNTKSTQLALSFCDKDGQEGVLLTSIMSVEDIKSYQTKLLQALNCTSFLQAIHGATLINLNTIVDEENKNIVIGLESDYGLILKNEIKLYSL